VLVTEIAVLLAVAGLFVHNAIRSPYPWINHDVAFLSWAGEKILGGARLYLDFQEMNPPGAHYLHAGIAAVAHGAGLPVILADHLFVLALAGMGCWVLRRALADEPGGTAAVVGAAYLLVVVRGNFSNNIIPSAPSYPWDFGQREHLFALVFVPYVLWRLSRRPPRGLILAFLGAVGFVAVFKPQWLALVALVEGYVAARDRRASPWAWAALAAGSLVPWILLAAGSWESVTAFFGDVVPMTLVEGYGRYGMGTAFFASRLHVQMVAALAVFALCWVAALRLGVMRREDAALPALVVAGTYASALVQGKYWSYHGMIYFGAVTVLGAWLLARSIRAATAGRARSALTAGVVISLALAVASSVASLAQMLASYPPKGQELVPLIRGRGRVMFVSTAADYAYAPLVTGVETVGPWTEHVRLTVLLAGEDVTARNRAVDAYAAQVAARIEDQRPELILFAPSSLGLPEGVHVHDVLAAHGGIPGGYEPIPEDALLALDPRLAGWVVYRRVDSPS
jgi:hypothetical protein